jgi:GNAT superfamily N-acetyltransferase
MEAGEMPEKPPALRLVRIRADAFAGAVAGASMGVPRVDPQELARHAPDLHLMAFDARNVLRARCSCWWQHVPQIEGHKVGTIGHYAAADGAAGTPGAGRAEGVDGADGEAGVWLIEEACREVRDAGCTLAIAPMDGNTWRRYRFIIERGDEPPFFLEPDQPDAWPDHFRAAGFSELATYTSALNSDLAQDDPRLNTAASRLAARGVTIRPFDPARAEADLRRIFTLSRSSFSGNYLYTPIDEAEFLDQYRRVLPVVRPELVLLAERQPPSRVPAPASAVQAAEPESEPELVGFLFALPDMLQMRRTGAIDTIIIKTVAVAPGAAYAGLGSLLVGLAQREAHARGYRRAIHALMHEHNVSRNVSRRYARTMRRYALFARELAPLRRTGQA